MKECIKRTVATKLHQKRIVLFGAGEVAQDFYKKNKTKLNISHCVSNWSKEWGEKTFLDELDVVEFKRENIEPNDYIVVCGPYAFRRLEIQLINCGYSMFEDFVESAIAECIMSEKEIVLFRGSCILRDIYECIIQSKCFNEKYVAIFGTDNYAASKYDNRVLYYASKICDYYIFSYRILKQDKVYLYGEDELPSNCKKISVSNITFPGYWPQADPEIKNSNKYLIHPYNSKRDMIFYHTLYRMEDVTINAMIEAGKSAEEIYELISKENFYDEKTVKRNLKVAFKSLQIAEQFADVKVMDFIQEKYKTMLIFQNFSHMHGSVIWEYVKRLMTQMNIDNVECMELEEKSPKYIHHGGDIPIYPSVAKTLGLKWINEFTKYEIMTYYGIEEMTFRQYVFHYVEYTEKVREIMKVW